MIEKPKETIKRLGPWKYLHRITPILDASGKVINTVVKPLMVEMRARDVAQVIIAALPSFLSGAVADALK